MFLNFKNTFHKIAMALLQILENDGFNSLLMKMLQFFYFMLIIFDFNLVVKISYEVFYFAKISIFIGMNIS